MRNGSGNSSTFSPSGTAAPGDAAPYTHPQSRRDCVLQPRVASNELLSVRSACAPQLRRSCAVNSVSQSNLPEVSQYIAAQEQHHKKMSFEDELRALLRKHNIEWDERCVWD